MADLWDKQYEQQVMLIDDIRDVFGMALKLNGFSINTKNEEEIKKAYESLVALKKNVLLYNSDAHTCLTFLAKPHWACSGTATLTKAKWKCLS